MCEQVAALPWRVDKDGKLRILLVTSRTNGKWMLPKGWLMDGRAPHEAAAIEAQEEAGVVGQANHVPIGTFHYIKLFNDGGSAPAQATVFPVKVTSELKKWDEKKERSRRWMRPKEASKRAFEPDLKRFLSELSDEALQMVE